MSRKRIVKCRHALSIYYILGKKKCLYLAEVIGYYVTYTTVDTEIKQLFSNIRIRIFNAFMSNLFSNLMLKCWQFIV